MRRYSFIDVANTKGSAGLLGFQIDPQLLYDYLCNEKWSCGEVFWYAGRIHNEKNERAREKIERIGYTMRDKDTHFHKRHGNFDGICPKCGETITLESRSRRMPKANCDVELTIDALERAGPESEILLFTGDGDFRYLIEKLVEKGSRVRIFSTNKQDTYGSYRLSTRIKDLLSEYEKSDEGKNGEVTFTELNNLRKRIGKERVDEDDQDIN
jgi:uncharacterized LabA/DUF88 family protein